MHNTYSQYSPLNKRANHSPTKLSSSISLSQRSHTKNKTEVSPRKLPQYTVHHDNKLKVFIKFRPPTISNAKLLNVSYLNNNEIEIQRQSSHKKVYNFDRVYHHSVTSQQVFSSGCKEIIDQCISNSPDLANSKNGLIFVYGHTGTGKTYTMGLLDNINYQSKGIVPESLRYIFNQPNVIKIGLSFNEIYMDQVYDMLDFESDKKMVIREHQTSKQPYIQNQIMIYINSVEEAYQLINIGLQKRKIAEQKVNKRSSRGHGLLTVNIATKTKESKICFVDLAGSERVKESESSGKTLTQAVHINTSLSALQTLLMNIGQQSVRMYRGNKLTRLLQPFLESGKIRLFVTSNYENIQPIQFAKRCKGIKFMEREVVEEKSQTLTAANSQAIKKSQQKIKSMQQMNKNLLYCVTNMLGLINKISHLMVTTLQDQNIHSNFSLNENFSIKNEQLQQKINAKIQRLQLLQQQILDKQMPSSIGCVSALSTSGVGSEISAISAMELMKNPQNLINTIKDNPNVFIKKVHQIGFNIFQSVKQLSNLSDYRNIYKKQIFTSQLKASLLENKNTQFQNAINYLLKSYQKQTQNIGNTNHFNKVIKELTDFGINIGSQKDQKSSKTSEVNGKKKSANDGRNISPQIKNTNSTSQSRMKSGIVQNQRKNVSQKSPIKSAAEEYNEFLPFETEHTHHNTDVELFQGQNKNMSNQPKKTVTQNKVNKKQGFSPIKRRDSKKDTSPLLKSQRRSLILIEDL